MGLFGILLGLGLLMWLAYRGWSILLLAPGAALVAALRRWAAARLLDADLYGQRVAVCRAILPEIPARRPIRQADGRQWFGRGDRRIHVRAVGVAPSNIDCHARRCIRYLWWRQLVRRVFCARPDGAIPVSRNRDSQSVDPAAIALGTMTFTMSALPGTPAIQNAIPIPFFGTTPLAAPGLGIVAAAIMVAFGLWWLGRAEAAAHRKGEGYGAAPSVPVDAVAEDATVRQRATTAPRSITAARAPRRRRSRWRRCRSSWWSASMS